MGLVLCTTRRRAFTCKHDSISRARARKPINHTCGASRTNRTRLYMYIYLYVRRRDYEDDYLARAYFKLFHTGLALFCAVQNEKKTLNKKSFFSVGHSNEANLFRAHIRHARSRVYIVKKEEIMKS